jgi:hypothetical protein
MAVHKFTEDKTTAGYVPVWVPIAQTPPPQGVAVMTKIDDEHGTRNEQPLLLDGRMWWYPDRSMYVYYAPTHWLATVTR